MWDDLFVALLFHLLRTSAFFWAVCLILKPQAFCLSQNSQCRVCPAKMVRIKYHKSTFIFVILLSPKRSEEFIQRPPSTRTWTRHEIYLLQSRGVNGEP